MPLVLLALAACSSAPAPRTGPGPAPAPRPAPTPDPAPTWPKTALAEQIVGLARSLLDAPYRYGGGDTHGFDCSGLIAYVYQRHGFVLPRTAQRQSTRGRWVPPDELAPGDLIFFGAARDDLDHVGLVVSRPGAPLAMIHASTSRGVTETVVTDDPYWLRRLRFGRRVLP